MAMVTPPLDARRIEPGAVGVGEHVVQFYESDAELVARAGEYLREGARRGAVLVVIATEAHRDAFAAHLGGVGELVQFDAASTLAGCMDGRRIDRDGFFAVVGGVVRAAAAYGRAVRAYGEMVALLWDVGDIEAAIELEALWNELAAEIPFSLYCAYRSVEAGDARERVCQAHSAVVPPAPETAWQFKPERTAPQVARRLVADALRRMGHGAVLIDDARVVVTELAANAVLHARSPFTVSLGRADSTVRILVRDASPAAPAVGEESSTRPSGRGMRLVDTLASRWGVDVAADGKTVWAELAT
jgi:anti-sigma regulatory factor (Ser/Thr protein kinase)